MQLFLILIGDLHPHRRPVVLGPQLSHEAALVPATGIVDQAGVEHIRQLADTLAEQGKTSLDKWFDYFA